MKNHVYNWLSAYYQQYNEQRKHYTRNIYAIFAKIHEFCKQFV